MYANGAFKNPFADFDFSKFAGEFKFPVVPVEIFVETGRKNFAALTTASTAAVESIKTIAQRQGDMFRAAMEDFSKHGSDVLAAATVEEKAATCCYAKSDKQWIADPQGVPWETFFTHGEAEIYGEGSLKKLKEATERTCCEPTCCEPEPAEKQLVGCCVTEQ